MKFIHKILIVFLFVFIAGNIAKADQLAYLEYEQAVNAKEFMMNYSEVMIYCGCCDDAVAKYYSIKEITLREAGYQDYYEIVLEAIDENNTTEFLALYLAYTFVNVNSEARCIGQLLYMDCDPCVGLMYWESNMPELVASKWAGNWRLIDAELQYEYQLDIESLSCDNLNLCPYRVEGEDRTFL